MPHNLLPYNPRSSGFGGIAIGLYLSLMAVNSLLCVLASSETRDRDLAG